MYLCVCVYIYECMRIWMNVYKHVYMHICCFTLYSNHKVLYSSSAIYFFGLSESVESNMVEKTYYISPIITSASKPSHLIGF